nr:MAG TPA: hypothetical protein [Caudoviricetes sp.]
MKNRFGLFLFAPKCDKCQHMVSAIEVTDIIYIF